MKLNLIGFNNSSRPYNDKCPNAAYAAVGRAESGLAWADCIL